MIGVVPRRGITTSPVVRSGNQYRAERSYPAPEDFNKVRPDPDVFRKNPGPHHRHVLGIRHVREFIRIVPDWPTLAVGLNTILLAPHRVDVDGFHRPGLVAICAQPRSLSVAVSAGYLTAHQSLFSRLNVTWDGTPHGAMVHHTVPSLRAFQLLHVLLHELGHHHDRMTTRTQRRASRGERYAEAYANRHGDFLWDRYAALAATW
jgi:hypothetical protein